MTETELQEKMKDKPVGSKNYKNFYKKELKNNLAGYWNLCENCFDCIGERSNIWLVGGKNTYFSYHEWELRPYLRNYGFSGRLLKNK